MNAGNRHCATAFALVLAITIFAPQSSHADKKAGDAKAQKSESDQASSQNAEKSDSESEKAEQASSKAENASSKSENAKSDAASKSEPASTKAKAKGAESVALVEDAIDDDVPWYEQPLKVKAVAKPKPGKTNKKNNKKNKRSKAEERKQQQRARYGGAIGLGSRSSGDGPSYTERRTKDTRPKLSRKRVVKEIRANQRSIAYCRAKAGKAVKSTQLVLRFNVAENGTATAVQVTDTRGQAIVSMSRCLQTRMKSWSFPAGSRGGSIEYPLMVREFKATRLGK